MVKKTLDNTLTAEVPARKLSGGGTHGDCHQDSSKSKKVRQRDHGDMKKERMGEIINELGEELLSPPRLHQDAFIRSPVNSQRPLESAAVVRT